VGVAAVVVDVPELQAALEITEAPQTQHHLTAKPLLRALLTQFL
jgi:hypothetical protein